MKETPKESPRPNGSAAPTPSAFAPEALMPAAIFVDVTRFAVGTLLEAQKRTLEMAARHSAETARLGHEAVAQYEVAWRQATSDGQALLRRAAEGVESALERVSRGGEAARAA